MATAELYEALLEAAPDAIVGVGADGRIALVNVQTETLFGYDRSELIGQSVDLLVPDAARHLHPAHRRSYMNDLAQRPMGLGMELAGRRKDGTEFPAEISLSSIDTEDGILVSAAVRDVSERIEAQRDRERLRSDAERGRLEARMHQSQRLESLGQLAGGVAHDFNNLLAVILNYTTFITEECNAAVAEPGGERWAAVRDDAEQVQLAAGRAIELTHQLLAFGRREVVRPQPLSLSEVVRRVEQLLRRSIGEHVQLVIQSESGLAAVLADRGQVEQILLNLAVNARDAMPGGGTLTIDTRNIYVDDDYRLARPELKTGLYVRLQVSDTGAGMEREVAQRAFEPFFTTKAKGDGSGLGLATVYGIITQAGGNALIYSEPGIGTTVSALFPASQDRPASVRRPATEVGIRGWETILVVEDELALQEVTRRILARNGHTVLTASSGLEAIRLAESYEGEIHLLLTDVIMPQMLGKEVAERIRLIRAGIPVLFMSGYAQPVLTAQGTLERGVHLVEKPFSEAALMEKVRALLGPAIAPRW